MDAVDRQKVIDAFEGDDIRITGGSNARAVYDYLQRVIDRIKALPSVEQESFEWCHDCKEYDQDAHCCHRWVKCIRDTIAEIDQRWIPVDEELPDNNDVVLAVYECGEYGVDYTTAWREFDKWCCWDDRVNPWDEPIAWMRIPEFKRNDGDE